MPERVSLATAAARWPESVIRDQTDAQRLTHAAFTWTERALLLGTSPVAHDFLSWPASGTERWREGTRSGGGPGFHYRCTTTAVTGEWREVRVVERFPNGQVKRFEFGAEIGTAKVTYRRLQRWGESMPAGVREWAQIWDTVLPTDTRDPIALNALLLSLLVDPEFTAPIRALGATSQNVAPAEPSDLLELLEMTNV